MVRIHQHPLSRDVFADFVPLEPRKKALRKSSVKSSLFSLGDTKMPSCGNSSVDRALAFQAGGRGFEPRFPLNARCYSSVVEHFLGKEEVPSSSLGNSS